MAATVIRKRCRDTCMPAWLTAERQQETKSSDQEIHRRRARRLAGVINLCRQLGGFCDGQ